MFRYALVIAAALVTAPKPATAEGAQVIDDRSSFVRLVADRELTRLGIRLKVSEDGRIEGSAFGRKVTGDWRWSNGYFCRDLSYGNQSLGPNCQVVQLRGDRLRFIADEGRGDHADLRLE